MKSITVFVMLDACRHDYINKQQTPFLYSLQLSALSCPVQPTFGFEPDAAYLAGLYPDQADGGAQFWYCPEESPFKMAKFLPKWTNRLPEIPQKVIRRLLVKLIRRSNTSPNLSTARLPFHLLNKFALPMKHGLDHPDFCPGNKSIFDLLRDQNFTWLFHASPSYKVTIDAACKRAKGQLHPPFAFAFFHIGNLDGTGHAFGPNSDEIQTELTRVDRGLQKIYDLAVRRFGKVNFVVMGDHGMIEVNRLVNMERKLATLPLSLGRDYMYILDSTMARFWFFNKNAKETISHEIKTLEGGHIIDKDEKNKYHLNYRHNRFGDLIYLADPGSLIFPNHYQTQTPEKGMHGYSSDAYGQQALLLIKSERIQQQSTEAPVDMRRVFPSVCDLLNIPVPPDCNLPSLLEDLI